MSFVNFGMTPAEIAARDAREREAARERERQRRETDAYIAGLYSEVHRKRRLANERYNQDMTDLIGRTVYTERRDLGNGVEQTVKWDGREHRWVSVTVGPKPY